MNSSGGGGDADDPEAGITPRRFAAAIVGRVAGLLAFLLALHALLFVLFLALPSSVDSIAGMQGADPAYREALRRDLGLDRPWIERYVAHLARTARLDFGRSIRGDVPVGELLTVGLRNSIPLFLSVGIGVPLGALTMLWMQVPAGTGRMRRAARYGSSVLLLPPFVLATGAYALFRWSVHLVSADGEQASLDAGTGRDWELSIHAGGVSGEAVCAELADTRFVQTYRAIGMRWGVIRVRLLRNLWQGVRPALGRITLISLLSTAFVEWTFGINGFGRTGLVAFQASDFKLAFGWTMVAASLVLLLSGLERWPSAASSAN